MEPRFERWETPFSDHQVDLVTIRSTLMRSLTYPDRHYSFDDQSAPDLEIVVFDIQLEALFLVTFDQVDAFRVVQGRDLMDHWSDASRAAGTSVKQWGGSWIDEAPLLFASEQTFRYAIKCDDEGIEVVAPNCEPRVRQLTADEKPFTKSVPTAEQLLEPDRHPVTSPLREGARFVRSKG